VIAIFAEDFNNEHGTFNLRHFEISWTGNAQVIRVCAIYGDKKKT
jgi:hypothetical protein